MNWNQLQYVLIVAEEKNITRAAERLFLSQPSLSRSLKSLEEEFGTPLFQRKNGLLETTYAGTLFCQWAAATLQSHRQLTQKLSDISNGQRRFIRLGISPHRSFIFMPPILERFYAEYPECEVQILEKPTVELKELLEQDKLDLIVDVAHPDTVNYQSDVLVSEKVLLAVPNTFVRQLPETLQNSTALPFSCLSDFPFILLSPGQVMGQISLRMCEAASFSPDLRISCSNLESALRLAGQGLGITFAPEIFAAEHRFSDRLKYFTVQDFQSARKICLVYHKNRYLHRPMERIMELFCDIVRDLYN